jgi:2'-5' RNA ligase
MEYVRARGDNSEGVLGHLNTNSRRDESYLLLGLELSPVTKAALHDVENRICPLLPGLSWRHHERLHVTLASLGQPDEGYIHHITPILERTASGCAPFVLELGSLMAFRHGNRPSYLCAEVRGEIAELRELRDKLLNALRRPVSRQFTPHITLAQPNEKTSIEEIQRMGSFDGYPVHSDGGPFIVGSVALIHSFWEGDEHHHERLVNALLGPQEHGCWTRYNAA